MGAPSLAGVAGLVIVALGGVVALGAPAGASPLSDALARHAAADVATLRTQRADLAARCTLGAIYARRDDLARAALYLTDCDDAALPDDIARAIRTALRDTKRRLDASRYSALAVLSRPEGLTAEIDALPGESFTTPATIWILPGEHSVRATLGDRAVTQRITTEPHKNASILIDTALTARPPASRQAAIDFAVDEPGGSLGEHITAPPPDVKHPSLLSDKYRGIASPTADASLDDPLAEHITTAATERSLWLGARLGIGMFDDSQSSARAGLSLATAARLRITDATFLAARADWTRRGGDMTTIDTLGASAGLGVTLLARTRSATRSPPASSALTRPDSAPVLAAAHDSATGETRSREPTASHSARIPREPLAHRPAIALLAELRADVRLADHRAAGPVHRAGLGLAAGAELALPSTPFTVGLRFEQGLTDLVPGSRDRAFLAEIGIDVR